MSDRTTDYPWRVRNIEQCAHDGMTSTGGAHGRQWTVCLLCGATIAETNPRVWRALCALIDAHGTMLWLALPPLYSTPEYRSVMPREYV